MTQPGWLLVESDDLPPGHDWLTEAERRTADAMRVPKRRGDWLLGRLAAKRALVAHHGGGPPSGWEIRADDDGAPVAFRGGAPAAVAISISHSGGRGLCVVAPLALAPGGDLERIEPRDASFVETFFTAAERDRVAAAPAGERDLLVTLIWSAKESALKSLRSGLRQDTRAVEVAADLTGATGDWRRLAVTRSSGAAPLHGWWRLDRGFVITVATAVPTDPPVALSPSSDSDLGSHSDPDADSA